jgi:putative DNA primase/helicase
MTNLSAFIVNNPMPPMPAQPVCTRNHRAGRSAHGKSIPAGTRNATLSKFAGKVVIRYGVEDGRARAAFLERAACCEPPLENSELETIWRSAVKFFLNKRDKKAGGWKSPAEYVAQEFAGADDLRTPAQLIPEHFTDVEQAKTLARLYGDQLRFSDATLWIKYNGILWDENKVTARACVHDLSQRQMRLAIEQSARLLKAMDDAIAHDDEAGAAEHEENKRFWDSLYDFARGEQNTTRITAALTESAPYLQVSVDQLDADGFLLNTPGGTVDLRSGTVRPHEPADFITKVTGCSPGREGGGTVPEIH